jgi:hypothetical protein
MPLAHVRSRQGHCCIAAKGVRWAADGRVDSVEEALSRVRAGLGSGRGDLNGIVEGVEPFLGAVFAARGI